MCATSWCDLDLTFDLAYLMPFYLSTGISNQLYPKYLEALINIPEYIALQYYKFLCFQMWCAAHWRPHSGHR